MLRRFCDFIRNLAGARQQHQAYAEIDAPALDMRLARQDSLLVIDVRNPDEFSGELGHIKGARNWPLGELPSHLANLSKSRSQSIVVVCLSDKRSTQAIKLMQAEGYTDLTLLRGGMKGWAAAQLAVER